MLGKKSTILDWVISLAFCIIVSFVPILYIRKLLNEGTISFKFEIYDSNEIIIYLWVTVFLLFFIPIFVIAAKNIKIKKLKWRANELDERLKLKEKEIEESVNYYEAEKKVSSDFDKQKLEGIEQKYDLQLRELKKQINILAKENEELKKDKSGSLTVGVQTAPSSLVSRAYSCRKASIGSIMAARRAG